MAIEDQINALTEQVGNLRNAAIEKNLNVTDKSTIQEIADEIGTMEKRKSLYGVSINLANSNPSTSCTYIDGAVGMVPGWDSWKNKGIFTDIKPCIMKNGKVVGYLKKDDFTKYEDGTNANVETLGNDVMIEIPKVGYKITNSGSTINVQVTDEEDVDGLCYFAHSDNVEGDCDHIYVGAYHGYVSSNVLYSSSGKAPTAYVSCNNLRKYAANKGDGYEQFSFYILTLLQCLYLVVYKSLDSQTAIGWGYSNVGDTPAYMTGAANANGMCYGTQAKTDHMKLFGIEDIYGGFFTMLDGIHGNQSYGLSAYVTNISKMEGDYNGENADHVKALASSYFGKTIYIKNAFGDNSWGFIPEDTSQSGSSSTYFCDQYKINSYCDFWFGGYRNHGESNGMFRLYSNSGFNDEEGNYAVAGRLVYRKAGQ